MFGDPVVFALTALYLVPAALIAIPVHELGHGLAAYLLGDRSVRAFGYFRQPPTRYIDVYGALAVLLANVGWGRPIPVQSSRVRYGRERALYALAGPVANVLVAVLFGLLLRALVAGGAFANPFSADPRSILTFAVFAIYFLNLSTACFQLLPIPGLDGWEIAAALLRPYARSFFMRAEMNRQTVWMVCAIAVFFGPFLLHFSVLGAAVGIFFQPLSTVIVGQCVAYTSLAPCLR